MDKGRSKLYTHLNHVVTVYVKGERTVTGKLLAFDSCMNVVLADAEETRTVWKDAVRSSVKRTLGLAILRGDLVTTICGDKPPTAETKAGTTAGGVGGGKAANVKRSREETDIEHVAERAPKKI